MEITKASGEREPYQPEKLVRSLARVGLPRAAAAEVERGVAKQVRSGESTEVLFERVRRALMREHAAAAARYSLKKAIMELGPAGYYFERYIAQVLAQYGYETKTNQIVSGACVTHEIDVVALKGNIRYFVEAKYHNRRGTKSDIKDIMYTDARGRDIGTAERSGSEKCRVWLITNTKLTSKAKRYARCRKLNATGWRYPSPREGGKSLERLIEDEGLYPVTVLANLGSDAREKLALRNVYFAYELAGRETDELVKQFGLTRGTAAKLAEQVEQLLHI